MAVPGRPDPAAIWIRKVAPDDDYLPPVEPPTSRWQVRGHLDDDEGIGPEALRLAEDHASPERRRSREREWRTGHKIAVRDRSGRMHQLEATWTRQDYQSPIAPPASVEPDLPFDHRRLDDCLRSAAPVGPWRVDLDEWSDPRAVPPWESDPDIDESLLTGDDITDEVGFPRLTEPDDRYLDLADRHVPYYEDEDDRPQWEKEVGCQEEVTERADEPGPDIFHESEEVNGSKCMAVNLIEAVAVSENPNRCDGIVKAKLRCGPCIEYRRTHRGEERSTRLINRAKRRQEAG